MPSIQSTPDQARGASSAETCSGVLAAVPSWCTQRFSVILDTGRPALGSSRVDSVRYDGMPWTYCRTASRAKSSEKLAPRRAAVLEVAEAAPAAGAEEPLQRPQGAGVPDGRGRGLPIAWSRVSHKTGTAPAVLSQRRPPDPCVSRMSTSCRGSDQELPTPASNIRCDAVLFLSNIDRGVGLPEGEPHRGAGIHHQVPAALQLSAARLTARRSTFRAGLSPARPGIRGAPYVSLPTHDLPLVSGSGRGRLPEAFCQLVRTKPKQLVPLATR